jgi:hypothetical protein
MSDPEIGLSPKIATSGAGITGSKKISNVPPDKHGLCTVRFPDWVSGSGIGAIRNNNAWPSPRTDMPSVRTVDSAQDPPTKPSMVPSEKIRASSPGFAEVGFSAKTTRA